MLWKYVEEFEKAQDDEAQLRAARKVIKELQNSPLSVIFQSGKLMSGSMLVAVHGQQIGLLQELSIKANAGRAVPEVTAVLPEIVEPGDSKDEHEVRKIMEDRNETAMNADRHTETLESVGVRVERRQF